MGLLMLHTFICVRKKVRFCDLTFVCVQEVSRTCGMLVRLEPVLGIYSELVRYYLAVSLGVHRSTGKLLSVLAGIFTLLAQKVHTLVSLI